MLQGTKWQTRFSMVLHNFSWNNFNVFEQDEKHADNKVTLFHM